MRKRNNECIGRREVLALLGAGALLARPAMAQGSLQFGSLDHIEFFVSDLQRSLAFYTRVFDSELWKNNQTPRRYLTMGSGYVAIEERDQIRVDHFCAGIEGFDIDQVHRSLEAQDVGYRDYPSGRDLSIDDVDGIRTQLAADNSWIQLSESTASPESWTTDVDPIFRPTGLDHILLNVSDLQSARTFYEKFLGLATSRDGQFWFDIGASAIGLATVPQGQEPGVDHFAIRAESFDYDDVTRRLRQASIPTVPSEQDGSPMFTDPDGLRIQVL
jgi:catechol 2,3-dioxygenase-like lactoylglutathione lyase family enzyme